MEEEKKDMSEDSTEEVDMDEIMERSVEVVDTTTATEGFAPTESGTKIREGY